ncbi:MAG TPA: hypothetical protein VNR11_00175 [Xanthobacteraceae bacterium]|nr:hypothetical protein [Xanthobacteraceae bacterium]
MDRAEEYRKKAAQCRHMATTFGRAEHRTAWLELADSWLALAAATPRQPGHLPYDGRRLGGPGSDAIH